MLWQTLPIDHLAPWARLNGIDFNGVKVSSVSGCRGSGVITTAAISESDAVLMTIPHELVLSLENVWIYAKSDRDLLQVLEAAGEYSRTARGAILIFLLLQLTNATTQGKIGVLNPLCEYIKFLPRRILIPTFWSEDERLLLIGTSLEAALGSKLRSLDREFTTLRDNTSSIAWCQRYWWAAETETLTFDDWKQVDALYRSRALDLPGTGHAMVPCIDMANHASGSETTALYDTDSNGNATLVLRDGKEMAVHEEITITYGDEKGACEMLFSYGFIESNIVSARELFLDLDIPDDDPLKSAKKTVSNAAPGFRLFLQDDIFGWEGPFVWLIVLNEEDGLKCRLLQRIDGETKLHALWKDEVVLDVSILETLARSEPLWEVFHLRAVSVLQNRVERQLVRLADSTQYVEEFLRKEPIDQSVRDNILRLRDMEETLMLHAYEDFELKKSELLESTVVQDYLSSQTAQNETRPEDDFS